MKTLLVLSALVLTSGAYAQETQVPFALPSESLPAGRTLHEGDMMLSQRQKDALEKFGGFETNFWTNGIVPYEFKTESFEAVQSVATDWVIFNAGTPPSIQSVVDDWSDLGFRVGDEVRVVGSTFNDNATAGTSGYTVTAINGLTLTLSVADGIVGENALGRTVFVYETEAVTALNQQRFVDAVATWESVANVDFRPRSGEPNYVQIRNTLRNRADVGMEGGMQEIQMRAWSNPRTIWHETAHTLGVKHEQSRPDRDDYVTINASNVSTTACNGNCIGNFNISPTTLAYPTGPDGIYDFGSIMHYNQFSFAVDDTIPTIEVKEPWTDEWQDKIGTLSEMSWLDELTMGYLYPESNWRFLHTTTIATTRNGGFLTPFDVWSTAYSQTPTGGKLVLMYPEDLTVPGVYSKEMLLEAPLGAVIRGQ